MTAAENTLKNFTDAAGEAVAQEIARFRASAERESELRIAKFDLFMSDLRAQMDAVKALETELKEKIASVKDGESVTVDDVSPIIEAEIARQVAAMEPPRDGEDGKSVELDDVRPLIEGEVARVVAEFAASVELPKDGKDADPELIADLVAKAVSEIPKPENGKDADPELIAQLVEQKVAEAVAELPPPEKGDPGPMGFLPEISEREDRVYYQGEVVTSGGSIFQARRDTGKDTSHEDWRCVVRSGRDGEDGKSFTIRSTYDPEAEYGHLDVVVLNGSAFVARSDNPGPCPGEGWQLLSPRGKPGKPGDKGEPGEKAHAVTASVIEATIDNDGVMTIRNADGSEVKCDFYPLLSKLG